MFVDFLLTENICFRWCSVQSAISQCWKKKYFTRPQHYINPHSYFSRLSLEFLMSSECDGNGYLKMRCWPVGKCFRFVGDPPRKNLPFLSCYLLLMLCTKNAWLGLEKGHVSALKYLFQSSQTQLEMFWPPAPLLILSFFVATNMACKFSLCVLKISSGLVLTNIETMSQMCNMNMIWLLL